jgi:hypothetical protein
MSRIAELYAKAKGMSLAENNNRPMVELFRAIALEIIAEEVTIDDVRNSAYWRNISYEPGNWLGSIFTKKDWEWTGKVKASTHAGSHGRMVKIWRRKGGSK